MEVPVLKLKSTLALVMILVLLFACCTASAPAEGTLTVDECGLRGWDLNAGYQYVIMGYYPYEKDGTKAPVLWQVLAVEDGKALLYTTYIIDAHQPIEIYSLYKFLCFKEQPVCRYHCFVGVHLSAVKRFQKLDYVFEFRCHYDSSSLFYI